MESGAMVLLLLRHLPIVSEGWLPRGYLKPHVYAAWLASGVQTSFTYTVGRHLGGSSEHLPGIAWWSGRLLRIRCWPKRLLRISRKPCLLQIEQTRIHPLECLKDVLYTTHPHAHPEGRSYANANESQSISMPSRPQNMPMSVSSCDIRGQWFVSDDVEPFPGTLPGLG